MPLVCKTAANTGHQTSAGIPVMRLVRYIAAQIMPKEDAITSNGKYNDSLPKVSHQARNVLMMLNHGCSIDLLMLIDSDRVISLLDVMRSLEPYLRDA